VTIMSSAFQCTLQNGKWPPVPDPKWLTVQSQIRHFEAVQKSAEE